VSETLKEILADCVSGERNEATAYPVWYIVDPAKVPLSSMQERIYAIMSSIKGPFFSRAAAQEFPTATRYNFSRHAVVYCASGTWSNDWRSLVEKVKEGGDE
jgi:hypothetical protein